MRIEDEALRFQKFHDLVMNGMDYEDALKEVEDLPADYTLSESDKELFDALFKTEFVLKSLENTPEHLLPKEELDLLSRKLHEVSQNIQTL